MIWLLFVPKTFLEKIGTWVGKFFSYAFPIVVLLMTIPTGYCTFTATTWPEKIMFLLITLILVIGGIKFFAKRKTLDWY
ncbi:MAG: hypothetical protein WCI00_06045 [bacterium]